MDSNGSPQMNQYTILTDGFNHQLTKDGSKIIFNRRDNQSDKLSIMNIDGSNIRNLSTNEGTNDVIDVDDVLVDIQPHH